MNRQRWIDIAWFLVIFVASSTWCVTTARTIGATYDEPTYIEHGLHFWRTGSHRPLMRLGTMPLPMDVQTLPLRIAELIRGQEWDVECDFAILLPIARYANLAFWGLLLFATMKLGGELAGKWAGRCAAAAVAADPNMLAHAALATTDIAVTGCLVMLIAVFLGNRSLSPLSRIGGPAIWFGFALLSKASALVFGPLAMFVASLCASGPPRRPFNTIRDITYISLLGLGIAVVACGCDFETDPTFIAWAGSKADGPSKTILLWLAENLRIFGNAFEALAVQIRHNIRGHGQFLFGEASQKAFWWYFPALLSIKLPIVALAGAAGVLIARPYAFLRNPALAVTAVLFLFSLNCRVQIGVRLQLPLIAFLIVGLTTEAMKWSTNSPLVRPAIMASTFASLIVASLSIWPNGLCFANGFWGSADLCSRLMSDSNYDWGQGIPELAAWHERSGHVPLDVWYFGRDPALKRLDARNLPLHCVSINQPGDVANFCFGRHLAVSKSIRYSQPLNPAHDRALQFLRHREPVDHTTTFLIYDLTDLPPPDLVRQSKPQ